MPKVKRAGNHFKVTGKGGKTVSFHTSKKAALKAAKRRKG